MARGLKCLFAAVLACCAMAAQAHLFHVGITDLSFNPKTGSTELVHTYMTHDVDALLANLYQRQFDLSLPEDEAVLRKYVEKQFWVEAAGKRRLPLRWVGMTVDAQSIVIYQEIENTPLSNIALIHDEVLIDFLAEQSNTLNVQDGGMIGSLTFDRKKIEQAVR